MDREEEGGHNFDPRNGHWLQCSFLARPLYYGALHPHVTPFLGPGTRFVESFSTVCPVIVNCRSTPAFFYPFSVLKQGRW